MGFKARPPGLPRFALRDDLTLRPLRASDRRALFGLVDGNRDRLARWFDWEQITRTPDDVARFLQGTDHQHAAGTAARFAIVHRGRVVGLIGLEDIRAGARSAFFGYWIDAAAEGHGIVTESVRALCEYGFDTLGLHRLEIQAATGNTRSRAVAERLGFQFEGVLREKYLVPSGFLSHAVYSLLSYEWKRSRAKTERAS